MSLDYEVSRIRFYKERDRFRLSHGRDRCVYSICSVWILVIGITSFLLVWYLLYIPNSKYVQTTCNLYGVSCGKIQNGVCWNTSIIWKFDQYNFTQYLNYTSIYYTGSNERICYYSIDNPQQTVTFDIDITVGVAVGSGFTAVGLLWFISLIFMCGIWYQYRIDKPNYIYPQQWQEVMFLLGSNKRLAEDSSIYKHFYSSSLYDKHLIKMIFRYCDIEYDIKDHV